MAEARIAIDPDSLTLATRRLELRPVALRDADAIARLHADSRVAALLVDGVPDTAEAARRMIVWNVAMAMRGYGTFGVRRRNEPALIGLFSLTPFDGDDALLELGGKLAPSAWRGGLAVEAAAALIDHAFMTLGRTELVSAFHPGHRSAPAALGLLGFRDDGEALLFGRPVARMRLARDAWVAQGGRPVRPDSRTDYGRAAPGER
jgi:RimJ/RimL family protein N-acetyltransferase